MIRSGSFPDKVVKLKVLSYANDRDPRLKRWFIRSIEGLSGRDRYARLYDIWRSDIVARYRSSRSRSLTGAPVVSRAATRTTSR